MPFASFGWWERYSVGGIYQPNLAAFVSLVDLSRTIILHR